MRVREGLTTIQNSILDALESSADALNEAELLSRISGRRQIKVKALRDLLQLGYLAQAGSGKRGDPFRYSCKPVDHVDCVQTANPIADASLSESEMQNLIELFQLLLRLKQKSPKGIGTVKN